MKVHDIMRQELMILDLKASTKEAAIDEMIERLVSTEAIEDAESFKKDILAREEMMSTGLGNEIAMPHAKNETVKKTSVVFAKSKTGIDYDSLDGEDAKLFFMIAAEGGSADTHIEVLAALSKLLMDEDFIEALKGTTSPDQVSSILRLAEKTQDAEEKEEKETPVSEPTKEKPFIVAVTACPTGIAHTYMAEDALKKKAAEMGVDIRVETNGSDGVKHELTEEEIKRAKGVIVAVGKKVELNRFHGKPVLQRGVADGINKAEELITKAAAGDAPIFEGRGEKTSSTVKEEKVSLGASLYKDLMNGISHMLPFVIAGGIVLAISFLLEAFFGSESPIFISLNSIGSAAFSFLIPALSAYIAYSIADRPGLVGGFAGGFMAVQANAGFLGGIAVGFLAGYIMVFLKKVLAGMPRSLDGVKTILLYPVLNLLLTGILMYFVLSPIFGTINKAMISFLEGMSQGNLVLLGALLGGMMAIDMGGPFNKAAYTFAIGVFADTGNGDFMAAVMAGGMVPPLAIATASMIFKNKFTENERHSALTNFIMGLSFITEGAIPYAAADPLRVITSCLVGSALAGGLSQFWQTSVPAPHGGIFTMAALGQNKMMLILAILIGTAVSAIIFGLWRPKAKAESN